MAGSSPDQAPGGSLPPQRAHLEVDPGVLHPLGAIRVEQIGDATLYLGDARLVLPTIGQVDHVITDPPYDPKTHKGARTRVGKFGAADNVASVDFEAIDGADLAELTRSLLEHCRRWIVMSCAWQHCGVLEAAGLPLVRVGAWTKPNSAPQFTGDRPAQGWEAIAILHNSTERLRWNGGGSRAVWNIPTEPGEHPTQKPIALLLDWIAKFTDAGETVLDPFMGSGTTGAAALRLGRRFIGIEREEKYFDLACRRVAAAAGTNVGPLFGSAA